MQLSMEPAFPGYGPDNWQLDVTIWLDGVQQHRCVALDTEARTMVIWTKEYGHTTFEGHVEVRCGQTGKVIAASPPGKAKPKPQPAKSHGPGAIRLFKSKKGKSYR